MAAFARFCQNNLAGADTATLTVSSAVSGFPGTNCVSPKRHRKWLMAGRFTVTASNLNIYINDGSDKTVALTAAEYTTAALLAAHIQTQLNASSTNWTCTYSSATGKFTIGRSSGTAILRFTQTTNAAWSMLGYTGVSDTSAGTGLAADVRRNHTSESIVIDLGSAKTPTCFIAIGAADEDFSIPSDATVTLKANSINSFAAAPLSVTLTPEQFGIFYFFASTVDTTYRYWKLEITNLTDPSGPQFSINQLYLGDYIELTTRNVVNGFSMELVDNATVQQAESGVRYWKRVPKYYRFSSVGIEYLADADRVELLSIFRELGISTPFFFALDPDAEISDSIGEFTKYVTFDNSPSLDHVLYNKFNYSMSLSEVV